MALLINADSFVIFNKKLQLSEPNISAKLPTTFYPHTPIGMLGIYRLLFVFHSFCLSAGFLVTDISSVG